MKESLREYCQRTGETHLLDEWDDIKNAPITPDDVQPFSNKSAWWTCPLGHSYRTMIKNRDAAKSGCPICDGKIVLPGFNDLATLRPDLAAEWHPTLNKDLTPDQIAVKSNKKVWWICKNGHSYQAAVNHRASDTKPTSCPYCANRKLLPGFNDLATVYPNLAKQWHPTLNGDLTPDQVFPGSGKKVWWICSEGHVWQAIICNRTSKTHPTGCPVCAASHNKRKKNRK